MNLGRVIQTRVQCGSFKAGGRFKFISASGFQTLGRIRITCSKERLVIIDFGSLPEFLSKSEIEPQICISYIFSGDAAVAGS